MNYVVCLVESYNIGDWASILGVLVALIGFAVTIWNSLQSKRAAETAERVVNKIRQDLTRSDTIAELSKIITSLEEVRRLHREQAWSVLPDRYSSLQSALVTIKGISNDLTDEDLVTIQGTIGQISSISQQVEKKLAQKDTAIDVVRVNNILAEETKCLQEILVSIRMKIGG